MVRKSVGMSIGLLVKSRWLTPVLGLLLLCIGVGVGSVYFWSNAGSFGPSDLIASAIDYRQEHLQVVLMWGVDTWLDDPAWLAAASQAMAILRAEG